MPVEFAVTTRARPAAPHRLPKACGHSKIGKASATSRTDFDTGFAAQGDDDKQRGNTAANSANDTRDVEYFGHDDFRIMQLL